MSAPFFVPQITLLRQVICIIQWFLTFVKVQNNQIPIVLRALDLLWYLSDPGWPASNLTSLDNTCGEHAGRRQLFEEATSDNACCAQLNVESLRELDCDGGAVAVPPGSLKSKHHGCP
jgi:hypothetical protein